MPTPIIADTVRVVLKYSNGARNVLHVKSDTAQSPLTIGEVTTATQDTLDAWELQVMPEVAADVTLDEAEGTDVGILNGATVVVSSGTVGGTAGNALPDNVALVMSWGTGVSGRSFRGRTFLTGIPVSAQDADNKNVTQGYRDTLDVAAAAFVDELETDDFHLAVGSPTLGISTLVTSSNVNRRIDTQRRRLNAS